jgi:hypothetical protein
VSSIVPLARNAYLIRTTHDVLAGQLKHHRNGEELVLQSDSLHGAKE